jgi:hypothetical protein
LGWFEADPIELEEVRSKYKATDGYKFSKIIFNQETCEFTHVKIQDLDAMDD